jgi:hypothetical protein
MRLFRGSVLAAVLCVVPLAVGGDRAMAIFACGTFDGKFQCKETPGAAPIGKNATPGAIDSASPEEPPQAPPDGAWQSTTSTPPAAEGAGNASQGGQSGGWDGDGDGGRRRRRSIPASTHALLATASSPSRASMVIASRRRERLRQFRQAASMAWSERPPTATARRTQNCWAGTACTTPRRVTAGSRRTQILKLVPVPRKSLLARCARTD